MTISHKHIVGCSKFLFVVILVVWLVRTGKLDLDSFVQLTQSPMLLLGALACWLAAMIFGGFRWAALVHAVEFKVRYLDALRLTLTGAFFSVFLPGSVGGDFYKMFYLFRRGKQSLRGRLVFTVVVDRLVGVYALFTLAAMILMINQGSLLQESDAVMRFAVFIWTVWAGLSLGVATLLLQKESSFLIRWIETPWERFGFLQKVASAVIYYRRHPGALGIAFLYSCIMQGAWMFFVFSVTCVHIGEGVDVFRVFSVLPLAFLAAALPVGPGGLGVGHASFEQLFQIIGLSGGANVFNVLFVTQMSFNLLGAFSYLKMKKGLEEEESSSSLLGACS